VKTSKAHGKTAAGHTSEEFAVLIKQLVLAPNGGQEIDLVPDNLWLARRRKWSSS